VLVLAITVAISVRCSLGTAILNVMAATGLMRVTASVVLSMLHMTTELGSVTATKAGNTKTALCTSVSVTHSVTPAMAVSDQSRITVVSVMM
jgi:hypothetical protein